MFRSMGSIATVDMKQSLFLLTLPNSSTLNIVGSKLLGLHKICFGNLHLNKLIYLIDLLKKKIPEVTLVKKFSFLIDFSSN